METPKPSPKPVEAQSSKPTPKSNAPKKRPSAPVRNPAFREHEGLRALQKSLNSRYTPRTK